MDTIKEQEQNLFENEKYLYRTYRGFTYGFENKKCFNEFEKTNLKDWPLEISSKFVSILRKHKWRFFICESMDNEPESAGMCYYESKTIFITLISSMENSFFHELGHVFTAYAKSNGRPIVNFAIAKEASAFCEALKNFYLRNFNEKDSESISNYVLSQLTYFLEPDEYIAQAVSLYIHDYQEFKDNCPLTYDVAENIIDYLDGGCEELKRLESKFELV